MPGDVSGEGILRIGDIATIYTEPNNDWSECAHWVPLRSGTAADVS